MNGEDLPIEQQRFARTQTPESPRPVHLPEPAKIPVLLNQMDPSSNDLATYNIPADQSFAHYGESLENPAYKSSTEKTESDPLSNFLRNADSAVANQIQPMPSYPVPTNSDTSASSRYANQSGTSLYNGQAVSSFTTDEPATSHYATISDAIPQPSQMSSDAVTETNATSTEQTSIASGPQEIVEEKGQSTGQRDDTAQQGAGQSRDASGIDYQSLLDTITQSASTAPSADTVAVPVTESAATEAQPNSLTSFPGLPPKPPPLENQAAFLSSVDNAQAQQASNVVPESASVQSNDLESDANNLSSGDQQQGDGTYQPLPANPFAGQDLAAMQMQYMQQAPAAQSTPTDPADRPWSPKTQAIYDQFLEDERHYVTEGIWDRFPVGSRLFVGNLPSEKVTKRDLFHRFHKYGKLAQISIKQAYGFVQYHDAQSCKAALDGEQGVELRGRKVHLEISKPQKNSKNATQQSNRNQNQHQNQNQNQNRRRSRSPQRRTYSDYRDEPSRRRDPYRTRSPSPRGYMRDSRDNRRSPMIGSYGATPQPAYDDEASLPYPRRDPRYVPDVQVIVLDTGVNQAFVNWVEDGLRRKGLSAASTWLNSRTPLAAVVKRQIMEGVQAVVKVGSEHQTRSKIPLQVFDRRAGTSNVTFNEYVDLDVPVAADIILQARQRERGGGQPHSTYPPTLMPPQNLYQHVSPTTQWPPQPSFQLPHVPPPQQYNYLPQAQQQAYRPPPYPTPNSATAQPPNLHDLLANLKGGVGAPPTPQSAHSAGQPFTPYGQPPPPPPQYYSQPAYPQQQQGANGQPSVQNIMDQLARFQR